MPLWHECYFSMIFYKISYLSDNCQCMAQAQSLSITRFMTFFEEYLTTQIKPKMIRKMLFTTRFWCLCSHILNQHFCCLKLPYLAKRCIFKIFPITREVAWLKTLQGQKVAFSKARKTHGKSQSFSETLCTLYLQV